jgi:hypothetical protein
MVNWLWLLSIFAGLKSLGSLQYRGGVAEFFLTIEFNYIIICIKLCRCIERNQQLIAHIWSQLVPLAARMTYPYVPIKKRHLCRLPMLPLPARFHSAEAACLRSGINSPASTRHSGRTTFQFKFVSVLVFLIIT